MIRAALALAFLAGPAWAETSVISFQGITFGAPLSEGVTPLSSQIVATTTGVRGLDEYEQTLCLHELTLKERDYMQVLTETCEGAVVAIVASTELRPFFDTELAPVTLGTGLADFTFGTTTLADVRAQLCSEGLIAAPNLGQQEPDLAGTFEFAYEIEAPDAVVTFIFGPERPHFVTSVTPETRDDTYLKSIAIMSDSIFKRYYEVPPTPSAGYLPIPNIFDPDQPLTPDCALS